MRSKLGIVGARMEIIRQTPKGVPKLALYELYLLNNCDLALALAMKSFDN